jgi:hypothetical protein
MLSVRFQPAPRKSGRSSGLRFPSQGCGRPKAQQEVAPGPEAEVHRRRRQVRIVGEVDVQRLDEGLKRPGAASSTRLCQRATASACRSMPRG